MRFVDTHVDRENRFSLGKETESGVFYLSIPVSNQMVDYEEYYQISRATHDSYPKNRATLIEFANECRSHQHDDILLIKPGKDRGIG